MDVLTKKYFDAFSLQTTDLEELVRAFNFGDTSEDLVYSVQASAVFSSNIEGNSINLNSFMNYQLSKMKFKPHKELLEIEDLILAYNFAQKEKLTEKNFLKTHKILSKIFLISGLRGKYRNDKVGVFGESGLVYLAVEPEFVPKVMKDFFGEINTLLSSELSMEEIFYFAAFIHLRFVHIHPFRDGNGRAARLLEKWFLAEKLGEKFWQIPSEKYYKENQQNYYKNINIGINFYELNYDKSVPFLTMLPQSLKQQE